MAFNPETCAIPTVYCGDKERIPPRKRGDDKYYVRKGTAQECLSKGFGAGTIVERLKNLPEATLQQIKYVGETYEANFIRNNVRNVDQLIAKARQLSKAQFEALLRRVFQKKKGGLDLRAYNSTLLFLYKNGVADVPPCIRIEPE